MLLSNLDILATAPGGVARLRELILTLAVQGKLVPQDAGDEPASVLLAKIRVEKERLFAEGRIKRDKPLAAIAEEEKPFELPLGWEWCRLSALVAFENGDRGSNYPSREKFVDAGIAFINAGHLQDEYLNFSDMNYITQQTFDLLRSGKISRNDILYCLRGSLGKFALVNNDFPGAIASSLVIIRAMNPMNHAYLMKYLASPLATRQMRLFDNGTAQPNLGAGDLAKFVVPLPSLPEQSRIVTRVEELMRLCDALEAKGKLEAAQHARLVSTLLGTLTDSTTPEELTENWQRVSAHFDLLLDRPEAVDALEQTILQLAVRGLLVAQDPQDEPASELLKKIRAEKDELIAEGKIKRDKPLPPIAEDERPFALPHGWEFVRLIDLMPEFQNGASSRGDAGGQSTTVLRLADIKGRRISLADTRQIPIKVADIKKYQLVDGDILITRVNGSADIVGQFNLCDRTVDAIYCDHFIRMRIDRHWIAPDFCALLGESELIRANIKNLFITTAGQKTVNQGHIGSLTFGLPPLAEQSRIVARVASLRRLCFELRQRLKAAQSTQAQLAQALIEEVA